MCGLKLSKFTNTNSFTVIFFCKIDKPSIFFMNVNVKVQKIQSNYVFSQFGMCELFVLLS